MAYRIVSPRVGEPGAAFHPNEDVNLDALLAGGFIEEVTTAAPKSARKDISNEAPDAEQITEE